VTEPQVPGTRLELVRPEGRGILSTPRPLGSYPNNTHSSSHGRTGTDTDRPAVSRFVLPNPLPVTRPHRLKSLLFVFGEKMEASA
jgi:hypothetical protein